MNRSALILALLVPVAACADADPGDVSFDQRSPQEIIVINDPAPSCPAGSEAQSIEGQWQCVCLDLFACGLAGTGGLTGNPTTVGVGVGVGVGPSAASSGSGGAGDDTPPPELVECLGGCQDEGADAAKDCRMNGNPHPPGFIFCPPKGHVFVKGQEACIGITDLCFKYNVGVDGKSAGIPAGCTPTSYSKSCKLAANKCTFGWWDAPQFAYCDSVGQLEHNLCRVRCFDDADVEGKSCTASSGATSVSGQMDANSNCTSSDGDSVNCSPSSSECSIGGTPLPQ